MAAKILLILAVAVFSVTLAMPSPQMTEMEPKENMKSAETAHIPFSFGIGIGIPGLGYASPYGGYRGGYGYPYHYGPYDYSGYLPHFMHHHY